MVTYLMALQPTPIICGVMCHPTPEPNWWDTITEPSLWLLASHDKHFTAGKIAQLCRTFEPKQKKGIEFDHTIFPGETGGEHVRPVTGN